MLLAINFTIIVKNSKNEGVKNFNPRNHTEYLTGFVIVILIQTFKFRIKLAM